MAGTTPEASGKAQRVLSCLLCQQRKVKCDRVFPCSGCVKAGIHCIPSSLVSRQRKRRFPERDLLTRIRAYEKLLAENNIKFDPLHGAPTQHVANQHHTSPSECASTPADVKADVLQPKNFWHAMKQAARDNDSSSDDFSDDAPEPSAIEDALHRSFQHKNDDILFGSPDEVFDLSTFHPNPIQIFRLWQMYLDNVDPLFKVTHGITLQSRIVEAAANLGRIPPSLEALMFGIYCVAINSLTHEDCQDAFASSKDDLLRLYQFGCQQALKKAGFLRTRDRDCLTALFLYLVSIGRKTHPQSVSSLCGVAMRIAQHMGIHTEAGLAKCTPFEAEMRRRLWWALVLFDRRIAEVSGSMGVSYLVPTWDCKIPLNVSDSELRPEMSEPPKSGSMTSDAIFAAARAEFGDFSRRSSHQLDFTCPWLKPLVTDAVPLSAVEEILEEKYVQPCDPKNPLQYMTICMMRAQLATARLIEYFCKHQDPDGPRPSETQRGIALSNALKTLDCNTRIMTSPLTKRFRWLIQFYFPFPHYFQIFRELKRHPLGEQTDRSWAVMDENYQALFRSFGMSINEHASFRVFAKLILSAWQAREAAELRASGEPPNPPRMVSHAKQQLELMERKEESATGGTSAFAAALSYSMVDMSMDSADQGLISEPHEGFQMLTFADPDQLTWDTATWT